jgi:hypothetical protein
MRNAAFALILLAAVAGSSEAQGRGRGNGRAQNIPPGQMPRAGECRVWYDGVPPGRQPAATSCDQAERIASRSSNARVIYGDAQYRDRSNGAYGYPGTYGNGYPNGNTYPNGSAYPNSNTYPNNGRSNVNSVAYDSGYRDGLEKGREDANRNNSYDPVRHSWYRSGDRGYNSRYGTKDSYKLTYRDGFEAGYDQSYRQLRGYGANSGNTGGFRLPRF